MTASTPVRPGALVLWRPHCRRRNVTARLGMGEACAASHCFLGRGGGRNCRPELPVGHSAPVFYRAYTFGALVCDEAACQPRSTRLSDNQMCNICFGTYFEYAGCCAPCVAKRRRYAISGAMMYPNRHSMRAHCEQRDAC
jgi:hypothetical protein